MEYLHLMLKPFVELSPLLTRNEVKSLSVSSPWLSQNAHIHINTEAQFKIKSVESKIHPVLLQPPVCRASVCIIHFRQYIVLITIILENTRACACNMGEAASAPSFQGPSWVALAGQLGPNF